jgi:hypothetical protein
MLAEAINSLKVISTLMKSDFTLFYYQTEGNKTFYISTENSELYNSAKFLSSKSIARRMIKTKECKLIFCCIGNFEKFSTKEKLEGRKIKMINRKYVPK